MGPKMDPKLVQNLTFSGSIFGSLFLEVLELFGGLLGAFLGLLSLSWEASGPQKHQKTLSFLGFWDPEASQESLKRPKKPPKRPRKSSKTSKKRDPKIDPKKVTFWTTFGFILGSFWDPKVHQK